MSRDYSHNPTRRLGTSAKESLEPVIHNTPALPAIDWSRVGQHAPALLQTSSGYLPQADAVVITWAEAEWAAMEHVFCSSSSAMPYSDRSMKSWSGWVTCNSNMPSKPPSGWSYWGEYRLVEIAGHKTLLFKSNTHLDWPGDTYLQDLIRMLAAQVKPSLILSIGTAGGAATEDHIGTVRAISAGTLYEQGAQPDNWPIYSNVWQAGWATINAQDFSKLLFAIPTTASDLQGLCNQFNQFYKTDYSLAELDPSGLNEGDSLPQINNQTGGDESLLTTSTFVVGTTAGTYSKYACIEMDDAIIGQVCSSLSIAFGFIRNVSDPVQNAALPSQVQGNWGSVIYTAYGLYTSYNGALAAWAALIGQFSSK